MNKLILATFLALLLSLLSALFISLNDTTDITESNKTLATARSE